MNLQPYLVVTSFPWCFYLIFIFLSCKGVANRFAAFLSCSSFYVLGQVCWLEMMALVEQMPGLKGSLKRSNSLQNFVRLPSFFFSPSCFTGRNQTPSKVFLWDNKACEQLGFGVWKERNPGWVLTLSGSEEEPEQGFCMLSHWRGSRWVWREILIGV